MEHLSWVLNLQDIKHYFMLYILMTFLLDWLDTSFINDL